MSSNTLQHGFTRTKAWRHFVREYCQANGITGSKAVINSVMADMIAACSDNQIRDFCALFLQEVDLSREEFLDILHFLCRY